jgi:cell division protein FtsQ
VTVVESAERFTAAATKRRGWRTWLLAATGALLLGVAVWAVGWSSLLDVDEVRVLGARTVPVDEVRTPADVDLGTPLARVDADAVAARVAAIPEVASVEVRRGWPDVLVVVITERTPLAVVRAGDGYAYVDAAGVRFGGLGAQPPSLALVRATGTTGRDSVIGVLAALPAGLRTKVVTATGRSRDSVVLALKDGTTVQWGGPEDSARKLAVLTALLPRKAAHYDVSAPDLPTTRGTLRAR